MVSSNDGGRDPQREVAELIRLLEEGVDLGTVSMRSSDFAAALRSLSLRTIDPCEDDAAQRLEARADETLEVSSESSTTEPADASSPRRDRYERRRLLGRGGMGAVYEVWDAELRRSCAMKVAFGTRREPSDRGGSSEVARLSRFLEEAQVTGQLEHPGVPPVHELGFDAEGQAYFTMRRVRGSELSDILPLARDEADGWNLSRAVGVLVKACQAVAYAHAKGVIHRDLKPSNVMVGRFGEVYVMDWGLAKVVDKADHHDLRPQLHSLDTLSTIESDRKRLADEQPDSPIVTMDGTVLGTPVHMSPEQARGDLGNVDQRADVYSLGTILYTLLAGRPPYVPADGPISPRIVLARLIAEAPSPLSELAPHAPVELVAICDKAMERDPAQRYESSLELAEDLQAYLDHRVVRAYRTGALEELKRWVRRNRSLSTFAAFALAALITGAVTSTVLWRIAEGRRLEAERQTYFASITAAGMSLVDDNVGETRRRLENCTPGQRDWEWRHLDLARDLSLRTLEGHELPVLALCLDESGVQAASGASDGTVRTWNVDTGEPLRTLVGHERAVSSIAYLPGSRTLVTASLDGSARLWDPERKSLLAVLRDGDDAVHAVAVRPDGSSIATASDDGGLRIWSVARRSLERVARRYERPVVTVTYTPDGRHMVVGTAERRIDVLDASTDRRVSSVVDLDPRVVAVSPDGSHTAAALWDRSVRVWRLDGGVIDVSSEQRFAGHRHRIDALRFLDDGRRLVSASADSTLRVVSIAATTPPLILRGHEGTVHAVAVHGPRVVSSSSDGTLRVWHSRSSAATRLADHDDQVYAAAFSEDGRLVASGGRDRALQVWDAASGQQLARLRAHEERISSLAIDRSGSKIATASWDGTVRIWSRGDDDATWAEASIDRSHDGPVKSVAFGPDGSIVSAGFDRTIRIRGGSLAPRVLVGHAAAVNSVAISADGNLVVSGSGEREGAAVDTSVRLWDLPSGTLVRTLEGHRERVLYVAISSDSRWIASASWDHTVRIWSTETGAHHELARGHNGRVNAVAFSPTGNRLFSVGYDRTVRVWDVQTGEGLLTLEGHTKPVYGVSVSADGARVASTSADGSVRIWESDPTQAERVWRSRDPRS